MDKKHKVDIQIPSRIMDGLSMSPIDYLRRWWEANSTEEERAAADERDATIEGAYAFVEDFSHRAKHKGGACLPDDLVYELCGIFMRVCRDGDVYATSDEIAKADAEEKMREEAEARRKAEAQKRKEEAERKEAERLAAMSDEEREAYSRELEERKQKETIAKAEAEAKQKAREAAEAVKKAKMAEIARKKALAAEMEARQLTLF